MEHLAATHPRHERSADVADLQDNSGLCTANRIADVAPQSRAQRVRLQLRGGASGGLLLDDRMPSMCSRSSSETVSPLSAADTCCMSGPIGSGGTDGPCSLGSLHVLCTVVFGSIRRLCTAWSLGLMC